MTPKSLELAQELVMDALYDTRERRTELQRQAKNCSQADALPLWGEAQRLGQRIRWLRVLESELADMKAGSVDPFS